MAVASRILITPLLMTVTSNMPICALLTSALNCAAGRYTTWITTPFLTTKRPDPKAEARIS